MECMYVGKSVNIKNRFSQHMNNGSKVSIALRNNKDNIRYYSYAECKDKNDIDLYEMLYTSILNPKLAHMSWDDIELRNII